MEEDRLVIVREGQEAFQALAALKSGEAALLYALAAAEGGRCTPREAEVALELSPGQVRQAAALLCLNGLMRQGPVPPEPAPQHPADIARTREGDPRFKGLCDYLESGLGRVLRRAELEILHHVYGTLGLPADVLVLIIGWCKENGRLSAREIERLATRWHDAGVNTYEQAEAYVERGRERRSREWAIRRLLGISERKPGESEGKYLEKWVAQGHSDALISLAYDRTVGRTGRLSWAYMDKILTSWQTQGLTTPDQVQAGDKPPAKGAAPKAERESVAATVLKAYAARRLEREERIKARLAQVTAQSPGFEGLEAERRLCASRLARAAGESRQELETQLADLTARRVGALKSLGLPEDFLDDRPQCPHCGDRGYVGSRMCSCFQAACQAEEKARSAGASRKI